MKRTQKVVPQGLVWSLLLGVILLNSPLLAGDGQLSRNRFSGLARLNRHAVPSAWAGAPGNAPDSASTKARFSARYVFLSLLLPGAGQWFMGYRANARFFFLTELALWGGFWASKAYTGVLRRDYQAYAAVYAAVNTRGKDDQYWIDIGNADNIYQFNERQIVRRNLEGVYPETREYYWQWASEQARLEYVRLRSRHQTWKRRTTLLVAGFILNRLISAVDVVRLIKKESSTRSAPQSRLFWKYEQNLPRGEQLSLHFAITW